MAAGDGSPVSDGAPVDKTSVVSEGESVGPGKTKFEAGGAGGKGFRRL